MIKHKGSKKSSRSICVASIVSIGVSQQQRAMNHSGFNLYLAAKSTNMNLNTATNITGSLSICLSHVSSWQLSCCLYNPGRGIGLDSAVPLNSPWFSWRCSPNPQWATSLDYAFLNFLGQTIRTSVFIRV